MAKAKEEDAEGENENRRKHGPTSNKQKKRRNKTGFEAKLCGGPSEEAIRRGIRWRRRGKKQET